MIEKRISFYWSGKSLPYLRFLSLWSFRVLNPDWEVNLFLSTGANHARTWETYERLECTYPAGWKCYLASLKTHGVKIQPWAGYDGMSVPNQADMCRWTVLEKIGGWFADTDILFVDSMDGVTGSADDADAVLSVGVENILTGIMGGSAASRPFWSAMRRLGLSVTGSRNFRSCGEGAMLMAAAEDRRVIFDRVACRAGLEMACQHFGLKHCFLSPPTFHLWDQYDATKIFAQDHEVLQTTTGIHWWGGTNMAQRMVKEIDHANIAAAKGTLFSYARDLFAQFGTPA